MNLISLSPLNTFLKVESLDYPNPYDFKTPHRHDYFEIILIKKGGGEQLIDFSKTSLEADTVYVVYPRQIHFLKREAAEGLLIQFKKEVFEFIFPLQYHHLYFTHPDLKLSSKHFEYVYGLTETILQLNNNQNTSPLSIYKSYSYLQILLISLIEFFQNKSPEMADNFAGQFLQLVSQNIKEKRKVTDYAQMMNLSSEKLTSLCKESFGSTPLKIIHEELLLEIKRSIILGKLSLKEIAFSLHFENTSNFSAFVKTATKLSPSELQEELKRALH